ncbi:MAG: HlyD family type I secretion periplasmic adaptor subunit [Rhodospirillales bacterium]|nr:HlyD family type I secretion periplasmic adaptor subunit [Rhodospirillales bacterium]
MAEQRFHAGALAWIPEPAGAGRPGLGPYVFAGIAVVALFFGGFGSWSVLAKLESAALAPGVVAVESSRKTVQHLEGGIVGDILVAEGDRVAAGEVLIRLDRTRALADLEELRAARFASATLSARLKAERDGLAAIAWPGRPEEGAGAELPALMASQNTLFEARKRAQAGAVALHRQRIAQTQEEIAGLEGEIASQQEQLALLREEIADVTGLLKKGLIDKPRVLALRRRKAEIEGERHRNQAAVARARQVIAEAELRIAELETTRVREAAEELQSVERELLQLAQRITAAEDVLGRTEIRSPLAGRVVGLTVHTPGGVIAAGEPLMDIVPEREAMLIEAQIDPRDVDMVAAGQKVELRFGAFHQRDLPPIEGRLVSVSADRLTEPTTGRGYYLGRIALTQDPARVLGGVEIVPGMQADAIILTGRGTLLDYLLRPIERTFDRALRED